MKGSLRALIAGLVAVYVAGAVLLSATPVFAADGFTDEPPPTGPGKWTAPIFAITVLILAAGAWMLVKAYLKNNDEQ
ncbi:MAG: hypothetical protein HZY75_01280 [Nocardioidaceae bacterium]|nr:MAG: hypothetical protein HZY75_01280 [Nocardioidaceae bacterium]